MKCGITDKTCSTFGKVTRVSHINHLQMLLPEWSLVNMERLVLVGYLVATKILHLLWFSNPLSQAYNTTLAFVLLANLELVKAAWITLILFIACNHKSLFCFLTKTKTYINLC